MKINRDKVHGSSASGDKDSRQYWSSQNDNDDDKDYESMFRDFMEKLFANRGAFKVDGSLSFEFKPKANIKNEKLISCETSFFFHQWEEKGKARELHKNDNYTDNYKYSAITSYQYQENLTKITNSMEEFMPVI